MTRVVSYITLFSEVVKKNCQLVKEKEKNVEKNDKSWEKKNVKKDFTS